MAETFVDHCSEVEYFEENGTESGGSDVSGIRCKQKVLILRMHI
jgi:hypothetical protein